MQWNEHGDSMRPLMHRARFLFCAGLILAITCVDLSAQEDGHISGLIASCAACHGVDGVSVMPGAPSLGGQNESYLLESLRELKGENGHSAIMRGVTSDLSDNDLQQLARYFASLPYIRTPQNTDPERVARGEKIYTRICNMCHIGGGRAAAYEEFPLLAGQSLEYMMNEVDHIMSGRRHVEITKRGMIRPLQRSELEDVVHYFASQKVTPDQVVTSRIQTGRRLKRAR